jgi:putative flavoprotein involved in K+ transport
MTTGRTYDTIVIGGGQAGLTVGKRLAEREIDFVIFDAAKRVGDAWRNRWDSLRLFTPARMNGLPGMDYPGGGNTFIGKDDIADFLERYATEMDLPIRSGTRVERLTRNGDGYVVETNGETHRARNVVVAMADYQVPKVPEFAPDLDPDIVQLHSTKYRNPSQLQPGPVLVVGMGNSGADIAYEVAQIHETIISGTETAAIPFRLESWFGRNLGTRLVRFAMLKVLTTSTPIGRKARPKMLEKAAPLVRVRPKELANAGTERVERITAVIDGKPVTADGRSLDVANVIWCTGYRPGFSWVDIPVFDEAGRPRHERGVVAESPGLYFLGLFFLHAVWSETITGVQRDAVHIADHLVDRPTAVTVD